MKRLFLILALFISINVFSQDIHGVVTKGGYFYQKEWLQMQNIFIQKDLYYAIFFTDSILQLYGDKDYNVLKSPNGETEINIAWKIEKIEVKADRGFPWRAPWRKVYKRDHVYRITEMYEGSKGTGPEFSWFEYDEYGKQTGICLWIDRDRCILFVQDK